VYQEQVEFGHWQRVQAWQANRRKFQEVLGYMNWFPRSWATVQPELQESTGDPVPAQNIQSILLIEAYFGGELN